MVPRTADARGGDPTGGAAWFMSAMSEEGMAGALPHPNRRRVGARQRCAAGFARSFAHPNSFPCSFSSSWISDIEFSIIPTRDETVQKPFEGFIYVNINNPMAAWNVVRSHFYTPSQLPESERSGALSFGLADLLRSGNVERALAEFRLEEMRIASFPDAVSRLTGIFLFDSVESAALVWDKDNWTGHFRTDFLTDVGFSASQSSRHDAGWIEKMRAFDNSLVTGWETMAGHYWSGEPASDEPIWERIIEGHVTIWGTGLKSRALDEIKRFWPDSLPLLSIAANSAAIGSLDGEVMPFAVRKENKIHVNYYMRMKDAKDAAFCERLALFVKNGGDQVCRLGPMRKNLVTPDFSYYGFETTIEQTAFVRG